MVLLFRAVVKFRSTNRLFTKIQVNKMPIRSLYLNCNKTRAQTSVDLTHFLELEIDTADLQLVKVWIFK